MNYQTLLEVLQSYASAEDGQKSLFCWDGSAREYYPITYRDLSRRAFGFGAQLRQACAPKANASASAKGRIVMIACHSPYATLVAFYGAISVGAIPMIFPMPLSLGSHEALSERIKHWGFAFDNIALLVLEEGQTEKFHDDIPRGISVVRINDQLSLDWPGQEFPASDYSPSASDIAFFQTTSSSTGDHKAVSISHENIIANVTGIRDAQNMDANERMSTWLPLFHDMGLVGTVLFSFCNAYDLLIMTPTQFVKRPAVWLRGMAQYKSTIATAPNFGFDYCSRLVSDKDAAELDLSAVKHLFIGAEPIRVSTVSAFVEKFKASGISAQTIRPAYGLAESTIITTMTDPQAISNFICLDADSIAIGEPVKIVDEMRFDDSKMQHYDSAKSIAVCSAGKAIEGMKVDILDAAGETIKQQGVAGEVAITGTSVAMGYVSASDEVIDRFAAGRLGTGDLGVIYDDELYILERLKNIIIRNGENYLVSAMEEQMAELLNISHEHVVVFDTDIHDPESDIVVLVERHAPIDEEQVDRLLVNMPKEAFPVNKILLSKSREIARTTSGKKRHFYCRKMFNKNEINYQQSIDVTPQRIMRAVTAHKQAKDSSVE